MENLNAITSFFASLWQMFGINHPLLGIPFSTIYLGAFAIGFSITILKPLLGIGAGAVADIHSRKPSKSDYGKRSSNNNLEKHQWQYDHESRMISKNRKAFYQGKARM